MFCVKNIIKEIVHALRNIMDDNNVKFVFETQLYMRYTIELY